MEQETFLDELPDDQVLKQDKHHEHFVLQRFHLNIDIYIYAVGIAWLDIDDGIEEASQNS